MTRIIALHTDFGWCHYVSEMEAVIYRICPDVRVIHGAHDLPPHEPYAGAVIIASILPYYPTDAIHVCVVDPGVGTLRRCVVMRTPRGVFVGPDNGVLSFVAEEGAEVWEIDSRALKTHLARMGINLPQRGETFHGRDIFAPAASLLAMEGDSGGWLRPLEGLGLVLEPKHSIQDRVIKGVVIFIDRFGNAITDIPADYLGHMGWKSGTDLEMRVDGTVLRCRVADTYSTLPKNVIGLIPSSHGTLELALNQGRAVDKLGIGIGAGVELWQ